MIISSLKTTVCTALLAAASLSGHAQDFIARQAPYDKQLRDVQSFQFNTMETLTADLNDPASDIYKDWTDNLRSCAGSISANHKIDLRGFCMPTTSRKINSKFGARWGRQHEGIDVKVYIGDTIRAAFDGKVRICKYNGRGYGYYLVIRHPNGLETLYGHLSKQIVKKDQIVRAGEPIGLGGNTGRSNGSHLHFETRVLGTPINPALMFDFEHQDVTGDYYVMTQSIASGNIAATTRNAKPAATETKGNETASTAESVFTLPIASKQEVKVPQVAKPVTYSVKSGDSFYSIARKHGISVQKLRQLNGLNDKSVLHPGQTLRCS